MDILDNLIYVGSHAPLNLPMLPVPGNPTMVGSTLDPVYSYGLNEKMDFCSHRNPDDYDEIIRQHWFDIDDQVHYDSNGRQPWNVGVGPGQNRYTGFVRSSTYHLIYAYLAENTRILQIFERFIERYLRDEEFGIAENSQVFNWIHTSEQLFFRNDVLRVANVRSKLRPSFDAVRRNAYWRLFGMDLSFGDINSPSGSMLPYEKAKAGNQQFIVLFEKYISEVWQAYINARNAVGVNTTDIDSLTSMARDLQEMLQARRGSTSGNTYADLNLSREEFNAVLITTWFTYIISDDTPVVQFLNCQSSTIGERLRKIGIKVGIPAHGKTQDLFELAGPTANILRIVEEGGILDDTSRITTIISSLIPPVPTPATPEQNIMTDLLTIINHWEKATGHRIKNPEANIRGTVSIAQGVRTNGRPMPVGTR
ncbi:MAG: hypothetical protein HY962_08230 [Ignavibacteriae bacterium]|nr:hypothetical protein [Ignavibacteriota bacterium]